MIEASDGPHANPGQHTHSRLQTNMEEIILACFLLQILARLKPWIYTTVPSAYPALNPEFRLPDKSG